MPGLSNAEKQRTASEHHSSSAGSEAGDNGDAFMLPRCLVMMRVGGFQRSESEFVTMVVLFLYQNVAPRALKPITILYSKIQIHHW